MTVKWNTLLKVPKYIVEILYHPSLQGSRMASTMLIILTLLGIYFVSHDDIRAKVWKANAFFLSEERKVGKN